MTLGWADGFDHYTKATGTTSIPKYARDTPSGNEWSSNSEVNSGYGRNGGGGLYLPQEKDWAKLYPWMGNDEHYIGFWYKTGLSSFATDHFIVSFFGNADTKVNLVLLAQPDGSLELWRGIPDGAGSEVLDTAGAGSIKANGKWQFIELHTLIHTTTGHCEVRINTATKIDFDGNTRGPNSTGNTTNTFRFGSNPIRDAGNTSTDTRDDYIDDVYACEPTTSPNNSFLGPISIETVYPDADGDTVQWTPSAGSNYQCVDETIANTSDYVSCAANAYLTDLYNYAAMSSDRTIFGVLAAYSLSSDTPVTGLSRTQSLCRQGGTTYVTSGGNILGTTVSVLRGIWDQDPNSSSAWTASGVNSAQFGQKRNPADLSTYPQIYVYQHVLEIVLESDLDRVALAFGAVVG